ncbi:hypothetical protein [Flavobacterium sp.]|uniref:hypothetical protein n=1 Tax=Flavobacterium sp. TaxID=239 RepID=UPI00120A14A2|nr:hypothetical protein [Flavobacterium sp.]RZJ70293.1 MAG: hypothetical protein EOO49_14275 [Flavobacterium sp.]
MTANKDEWFLNDRWDEAEKAVFYLKLKRARYKKAFIIRAKASNLLFSGDSGKVRDALELFKMGIEECPDSDLLSSFYLQSALAHILLSNRPEALEMFRKTIEVESDATKFVRITNAWSQFALYVVRENAQDHFNEILSVIDNSKTFLVKELFLKHALKAIIFKNQEKEENATSEKTLALEYLSHEDSGLENRPRLGLVDKQELADIIEKLNAV